MRIGKLLALFLMVPFGLMAQKQARKRFITAKDTQDITFTGARINPYSLEYDSTGHLKISGYLDTYLGWYSDSVNSAGFAKFPTEAPRSKEFGLNIAQISAQYLSRDFRSTLTLFGGDCPQAAWSPYLNYVQEANLGFRLAKNLWLDAGFFRTHIGLESIQPRENMTISLATTTYFEPYFLSGAKLTWQQSSKWNFQLNVFNGFNQFRENNRNKAAGFSIAWTPNPFTSISFSTLASDELQQQSDQARHYRVYNNFCFVRKTPRWVVGFEANYGFQYRSALHNPQETAYMFSSLFATKYRVTPRWAIYGRAEWFNDVDEMLTGPIFNENHTIVGAELLGLTAGIEFKPIPNSYLRLESRGLEHQHERIFTLNNKASNQRLEILCALGVWF